MSFTEILFGQNWIISLIFIGLIGISLCSWYLIFRKIMFFRNEEKLLQNQGQSLSVEVLKKSFIAIENVKNQEILAKKIAINLEEFREKANFGQNFLASIANLTPFIGLFGTVLGVYFALIDISVQGNANIAVVARPIGEALVATAMGLWCAIPASFAYNFFAKKSANLLKKMKMAIDEKSIEIEERK